MPEPDRVERDAVQLVAGRDLEAGVLDDHVAQDAGVVGVVVAAVRTTGGLPT